MKCEKCEHINPPSSKFCEECGNILGKPTRKLKFSHTPSVVEQLDDVIFTPKKEDHSLRNFIFIFIGALFVIFIFLIIVGRSSTSSSGTSGNTDTNFDISCLTLDGGNMEGNSYYNSNPTYKATIHNGCDKTVSNVVVRVNFYQPDCTSANCTPTDTEYITVAYYLAPGDSYSINQTVRTNADTSGRFRWYAQVYTAKPL